MPVGPPSCVTELLVLCGLAGHHLGTFPAVVQAVTGRDSVTENRSGVTQLLPYTDESQLICVAGIVH
jgi:hypothetical protein